jgi:hypothetical protein
MFAPSPPPLYFILPAVAISLFGLSMKRYDGGGGECERESSERVSRVREGIESERGNRE